MSIWLSLPLPQIAEAFAESAVEVARLGFACRLFRERFWEDGGLRRLLAPSAALRAHTDVRCLRRLNPGSLRYLSADDAPAMVARDTPLCTELLASACSLVRLQLKVWSPWLQGCWMHLLTGLAEVLSQAQRRIPLEVLELHGGVFPAAASCALGDIFKACSRTLHEVVIAFKETHGDGAMDDAGLWDGLLQISSLRALYIGGLRTSANTCEGLTHVLARSAGTLRCLGLGRHTSAALLAPPGTLEVDAVTAATQLPQVSPAFQELLAAGAPMRLRRLALTHLDAQMVEGQSVGLSPSAANLAALVEALSSSVASLASLDLSSNAAAAAAQLPPGSPWSDGRGAFLGLVESCGPLVSLDITSTGLSLTQVPGLLAVHGSTLLELRLSGSIVDASMGPRGDRALQELCVALPTCDQLRVLDLGGLGMLPPMRRPVLALLQRCAPTLRVLHGQLSVALLESGLSSLFRTGTCREGGSRRLTEIGMAIDGRPGMSFVQVLCGSVGSLRRVTLYGSFGDAIGAALVQALQLAALQELVLEACGLGVNTLRYLEGAVAGFERCGGSRPPWSLERLSLSGNSFGAGVLPLLVALQGQRRLRELKLRSCGLTPQAGDPLGKLMMALPALLTLDLQWNSGFGPAGARTLLEASLREWGRKGSICGQAAGHATLPGCVNLLDCGIGDAEAPPLGEAHAPADLDATAAGEAHRPKLPRHLGRFELRWKVQSLSTGE